MAESVLIIMIQVIFDIYLIITMLCYYFSIYIESIRKHVIARPWARARTPRRWPPRPPHVQRVCNMIYYDMTYDMMHANTLCNDMTEHITV